LERARLSAFHRGSHLREYSIPKARAAASQTQWQTGWAAGGGAEWAFAPAWSLRVEYLHYDLGSHSLSQSDPAPTVPPIAVFTSSATFRGDIVRGGVNFLFH
jgi:outer membrane immunogenic protein